MFIFVFLFIFSFSDQSLIPKEFLNNTCQPKPENIDEVAAQLFAFGDPCHSFPTDIETAADLCAKYKDWTVEVDASLASYFSKVGLTSMYNYTAQTVCRLYEENSDKMIEFAKEVNSKAANLNPARDRLLDFVYAITQKLSGTNLCLTRGGFSQGACLIFKWFADTINELSESSQDIAKQIFETYLKQAELFKPSSICADLPSRQTDTRFASIEMNFVIGTKNCMTGL